MPPLGAAKIAKINELNSTEEYKGVCASHDFCDANQVMSDALNNLGFEYEPDLNEPINVAWDKAKMSKFSVSVQLTIDRGKFNLMVTSKLHYRVIFPFPTAPLELMSFDDQHGKRHGQRTGT